MAQGIARGWGIPEDTLIVSPAYNLVQEYELDFYSLAHIDFYRLDCLSPTDTLLFTDILERPHTVVLVEWAHKFLADLVPGYLSIHIERKPWIDGRHIKITAVGESAEYSDLIEHIAAYAHAPH